MMFAECGPTVRGCFRLFPMIGAAVILCGASSAYARGWNRSAAEQSFQEAKRLQSALEEQSPSEISREAYLHCIQAYRQVYRKDPHYGASDDAVYEAAKLYREMGESFGDEKYYKLAVQLFSFLVADYPASPKIPDALLLMGDLYAGPLGEEALARGAYEKLRTRYKSSPAAEKLASARAAHQEAKPSPTPPPSSNPDSSPPHAAREQGSLSAVSGVRHWSTRDYTRVIIDLDNEARYQKTRLSKPDRIYFDIFTSKLAMDMINKTFSVGDQFLKQIRAGQNKLDVVRIVLDVASIADYSVFELHDPFRIVIDIHGSASAADRKPRRSNRSTQTKSSEIAETKSTHSPPPASVTSAVANTSSVENAGPDAPSNVKAKTVDSTVETRETAITRETSSKKSPAETVNEKPGDERKAAGEVLAAPARTPEPPVFRTATPTSRGDRTMTRTLGLKIGRIVLDPGHGGHDAGTVGPGGLREKDLVLHVAQQLQKLLEDRLGAEVVLTRNDDTFIPLEERTAIANQHQADLFISIHANASRSLAASGVETYYLNFARSDEAQEVAARENASTIRNIRELQSLLRKIAQADKSTESRELAALLQKRLYTGARKVYPLARDRGIRSAPFVVLIGANMPSVLAEVGFISNPRDEKVLRKEDNRHRLAEALFAGIEGYMKTLGSDVAANQSN
jgi:N-acetylmuramoyl-L-alanine amidase